MDNSINAKARRGIRKASKAIGKFLCGVELHAGELEEFARSGRVPFRILAKSGLLAPGGDVEAADYYVRVGSLNDGPPSWGLYKRDSGVRVVSFLPGFPRAITTLKELFDAALANRRHFKDGTFIHLCSDVSRREEMGEEAHP